MICSIIFEDGCEKNHFITFCDCKFCRAIFQKIGSTFTYKGFLVEIVEMSEDKKILYLEKHKGETK